MKKFYPSTLSLICAFCLCASLSVCAQTFTGGTYTTTPALVGPDPHNWSAGAGIPIWAGSAPPPACSNCLIQLIGPGVVHMNTSIKLTNNSQIVIGSGVTLQIDNSGSNSFTGANGVFMDNATNSTIVLTDATSSIDASNVTGNYDGVFVTDASTTPTGSFKIFGSTGPTAGFYFAGDAVHVQGGARYPSPVFGKNTVQSFSGTLPIVLSAFNAALNQGTVDLSWTTAMEINSDHFSVQRSSNAGASWDEIGTVEAAGNSNIARNYTFTDNKPAQGTSEYRLQLIDKGGKYTYSDVKAVSQGIVSGVSIYPNPAHDYVNITLSGTPGETMLIRLFNQSGALLQEKNIANAGGTTVPLAVSNYPEGNYLIVVSAADGSRQISKLLITK